MTEQQQRVVEVVRTYEAGGVVLTCECGWLRYFADDTSANANDHAAKCKGKPTDDEVVVAEPPRKTAEPNLIGGL